MRVRIKTMEQILNHPDLKIDNTVVRNTALTWDYRCFTIRLIGKEVGIQHTMRLDNNQSLYISDTMDESFVFDEVIDEWIERE